jgi:hypothetical protein
MSAQPAPDQAKGSGCLGAVLWFVAVYGTNHVARDVFHWSPWPGQALTLIGLLLVTVIVAAVRQGRREAQAAADPARPPAIRRPDEVTVRAWSDPKTKPETPTPPPPAAVRATVRPARYRPRRPRPRSTP